MQIFSYAIHANLFFFHSKTREHDKAEMQSTPNHLWLLSDILGQGATANVFRGRHKVGTVKTKGLVWFGFIVLKLNPGFSTIVFI